MPHANSARTPALVTGASSGIGQATARLFAARGFHVFGTSRHAQVGDRGVEMVELDVRSDASVARCGAEVMERAGAIDVLVNNAGIEHIGVAEETTMDDARALFESNLFGVVRMVNAVLPQMRSRRRGRIINIGSLAAWVGEPGEAFYAASKRALAGYTESLRHELWPLGIHVSLIEPGAFRTGILRETTANSSIDDYDQVRRAAERTLRESLRRGGDPAVVANMIVQVASSRTPRLRYCVGPEARWIPLARTLLPERLLDYMLRRSFGLEPNQSAGQQ